MGHSQGTHIAANLAEQNPDIYALGYFSGNVSGRYSQFILQDRNAAKTGKVSREEAQANIEKRYEWWQLLCRGKMTDEQSGDPVHTWKSFSVSDVNRLVALKNPVYIAYGTEDDGPQLCNILPVYFELAGKTNYKMRPFVGCGHNFEEIMPDGSHNWDKMYWNEAVTNLSNGVKHWMY